MRIRFMGAAGTVTGSRTLVSQGDTSLLVDCGQFQGYKPLRLRNWEPLPVDPRGIDAVVLTHAHLDHSGWLPVLVQQGFRGPVLCTAATRDLCRLILMDSARINEEDANYANRKGFSRHSPAKPLFTEADARDALGLMQVVRWHESIEVGELTLSLTGAGHILGASSVRVAGGGRSVLFSGDLGRSDDLLMPAPADPAGADVVVQECTYGRGLHSGDDPVAALGAVIARVASRRGVVLIPAFSVGRSQAIMRAIQLLKLQGVLPPSLPVLLDSPMAVNATELYERYAHEHLLEPADGASLWEGVELIRQRRASKAIARRRRPYVLISAAGMLTGGRVLHHLARIAPRGPNALVFVGYQAAGTRGARILRGERTVRLHGQQVAIGCEVVDIDGFSAHADQDELLSWLKRLPEPPKQVVLNHGEPNSADAYRVRIEEELGWECAVARDGDVLDLDALAEGRMVVPQAVAPKPRPDAQLNTELRLRRVLASPTYLRADQDAAFLDRDDLQGVRLMLEYLKVDTVLAERDIDDTLVIWGGTRIREDGESQQRVARAQAELEKDPNDAEAIERLAVAERLLARAGAWEEARKLAKLAATEALPDGRMLTVVTGGGPGIMEAANRGAFEAGADTVGLNVTLPREQVPNPFISPDLCLQFRYFALRKMHFLERARALVVFPGGFGTLDELATGLCLMQTGKMPVAPIVLVGRDFWGKVLDVGFLAAEGLISLHDGELLRRADSAEEAWALIQAFYGE